MGMRSYDERERLILDTLAGLPIPGVGQSLVEGTTLFRGVPPASDVEDLDGYVTVLFDGATYASNAGRVARMTNIVFRVFVIHRNRAQLMTFLRTVIERLEVLGYAMAVNSETHSLRVGVSAVGIQLLDSF